MEVDAEKTKNENGDLNVKDCPYFTGSIRDIHDDARFPELT
jgi:hypothetical protein